MGNVFSLKKLQNKPSRNGFDLSRKNLYTAKVGELLPVCTIECLPGDKFNINTQHFTRTRPVNTAAYTRIREYYDWFFVPTNLLWNKFNSFVTSMTDNGQHARDLQMNYPLIDRHPYFTTNAVQEYLRRMATSNAKNIFNFSRASLSAKLLEYLDYGQFEYGTIDSVTHLTNAVLNPFPLLAYQKIYSDYYRDSQWEKAYAPAFNIDYMRGDDTGTGGITIPVGDLTYNARGYENMFDLRYCNWNKDYFMGLKPNTQYGSAATILTGTGQDKNFIPLIHEDGTPIVQGATLTVTDYIENNYRYLSDGNNRFLKTTSGNFTILALRLAEAKQKWAEITQSQQQDYKSQLEAHFNVNVSDAYSERCHYIDGHVNNLDISEVLNTNITDTNEATIAGKGVGTGDGNMSFSTDVHGYLMCIYHAVPLLDYATSGIARHNLKNYVTDYAIPEFDRTGMVSIPRTELINAVPTSGVTPELRTPEILGYAPRYYDYKAAYDRTHGGFNLVSDGFSDWVAPLTTTSFLMYLRSVGERNDVYNQSLNFQFFKVNPHVLDVIFDVNADDHFRTDQLLINCSFDIKAVRNLDYDGLPY